MPKRKPVAGLPNYVGDEPYTDNPAGTRATLGGKGTVVRLSEKGEFVSDTKAAKDLRRQMVKKGVAQRARQDAAEYEGFGWQEPVETLEPRYLDEVNASYGLPNHGILVVPAGAGT